MPIPIDVLRKKCKTTMMKIMPTISVIIPSRNEISKDKMPIPNLNICQI